MFEDVRVPELTFREQLFVSEYIQREGEHGVGTKAAIAAGYSKRTARQQASRLLSNADILRAIQERLDEAAADADEVLRKLTDHARGSMADFMTIDKDGLPALDFRRAKTLGQLHIVKSFKHTRKTKIVYTPEKAETLKTADGLRRAVGEVEIVEDTYEVELYDAQAALTLLGKHHKLFDRALEADWRRDFEDAGLDATSEFNQLKEQIKARLAAVDPGDAGRSDGGGEAGA